MKEYIKKCHTDGKFGNIKIYPNLEFSSYGVHQPGESLQEFIDIALKI